nr:hypothetical protein [Tanacetum cinerariifolium]
MEDNIRSDLRFDDAERTACLLNEPRRKQRKEAEVSHEELEDEDHVSTPSSDPLPSGEDSSILNELMRKSRSRGLRRLKKIGSGRRVKSPMEKDGLRAQEYASKQGRIIKEIDQNSEIALDDETHGRTNDDEMFGVDDLAREEVVMETTIGVKDSATLTIDVTKDEVTMAQALVVLKSTKPKVVVQEQEMSTTIPAAAIIVTTAVLTLRAKGIVFHKQKQSQIPIISSSKDKAKLQAREREESFEVQKARLLVELIEKRKKNFAALRAQEKRKTTHQNSNEKPNVYISETYRWIQQSHLKGRSFDEIKKLFDKEMRKVDENVEPVINDSEELKKCMEIVLDDRDEVLIEATPIYSRSPTIIDYKIHKEGRRTISRSLKQMSTIYYLLVEKVYPLTRNTLHQLWSDVRLQVDHDVEMAYDLLIFIKKTVNGRLYTIVKCLDTSS